MKFDRMKSIKEVGKKPQRQVTLTFFVVREAKLFSQYISLSLNKKTGSAHKSINFRLNKSWIGSHVFISIFARF